MLGVYISVPFCRTKCSYCNFASDVFSKAAYESYVQRVIEDIRNARNSASASGCDLPEPVDSIYLGGGTPSVLDSSQLERILDSVRQQFSVLPGAEITVECAPGSLTPSLIDTLLRCSVNRVSLGVQSFVDKETASVGRLHKRGTVLAEIARLRKAGLSNINIDLIAGLPHQTTDTWRFSLAETIATGAPHVSVYMLEVDEDSRLGRELIAGGTRYHAHFVPDDEAVTDFYLEACDALQAAGIAQYEISNFARPGRESRHNLKYWTRQPYIGFGVDAHSMLPSSASPRGAESVSPEPAPDLPRGRKSSIGPTNGSNPEGTPQVSPGQIEQRLLATSPAGAEHISPGRKSWVGPEFGPSPAGTAQRFSSPDSLDSYMNHGPVLVTTVSDQAALEERFFLGLRLNRGVNLNHLDESFGSERLSLCRAAIHECVAEGLLEREGSVIRLTPRGRLLSNEVFARFISNATSCAVR